MNETNELQYKKRIRPLGAVIIVIILAIIIGFIFTAQTSLSRSRIRKQLELGNRYLSELSYDEAIAAYEEALRIEPKTADAYIGLINSYVGLGDIKSVELVFSQAQDAGLSETELERVHTAFLNAINQLAAEGDNPITDLEDNAGLSLEENLRRKYKDNFMEICTAIMGTSDYTVLGSKLGDLTKDDIVAFIHSHGSFLYESGSSSHFEIEYGGEYGGSGSFSDNSASVYLLDDGGARSALTVEAYDEDNGIHRNVDVFVGPRGIETLPELQSCALFAYRGEELFEEYGISEIAMLLQGNELVRESVSDIVQKSSEFIISFPDERISLMFVYNEYTDGRLEYQIYVFDEKATYNITYGLDEESWPCFLTIRFGTR